MPRTDDGRDYVARVVGKPDNSGFTGAVGTGDFAPAGWLALSTDSDAPVAGDNPLPGRITSGTLQPAVATWGHTEGSAVYTLSKSYTSDQEITIHKYGVETPGGLCVFTDLLKVTGSPAPAEVFTGDQVVVTVSVTL